MADFRRHMCWEPETAAATINTEAVSPSRSVFLATHGPLRIRRARLGGTAADNDRTLVLESEAVDEHAVLQDFLNRTSDTGALLMPIVGDSGSGKSHLVRWVGENVHSSDDQKVIYLEKGKTSLKAVIKALLADVDSAEATQLKTDIDRLTTDVDQSTLARRLINTLEEALAATTSQHVSGAARILVGPKGLAVILQDPHVRDYMLASGKFIPQLAQHLLHDRADGGTERPERFTVDDLPLDIADIRAAAAVTQRLLGMLMTKADLQSAAVGLLNQHLETAVKRAFNLGARSLSDAMATVRREYARQRKEIILLIEDFALIQGVQRDLLDAVIEAANRDGHTILAPMRTLMAVTTGYFGDLPETALTRVRATVGYVYDLDVPFRKEDDGASHITSFVGRYLNAARIGRDELDRVGDGATPNRCERCEYRADCHEAFGATAEGHGLYPFNESALIRAVHSTASIDKHDRWVFVPRTVLGSVVRPVLIEHAQSLSRGEFPDARFREQFPTAPIDTPLSSAVRAAVDSQDPADADRRKLALEFWADAPSDLNAVDPAVLEAFGMGLLRAAQRATPRLSPRTQPASSPASTSPSEPLPKALTQRLQNVEEWVTRDMSLLQDAARDIRGIITEAVAQRYQWMDPLMRELPKKTGWANGWAKAWPAESTVVSIEGANELLAGAGDAPIRFDRTAENSQFFHSLLRLKSGHGEVRAKDVRHLCAIAEQNTATFTRALQRQLEISDADLVLGLRASLLGAALAGRAKPGMDQAALLSVVLDDGSAWERADTSTRTPQWAKLLNSHLATRSTLVTRIKGSLGVAQGGGEAKMIDAARALPLLQEAAAEWRWSITGAEVPSWIRPAVSGFASWPAVIDDQIAQLELLLREVRTRHPRGTLGSHTLAAVRNALIVAKEVSLPLSSAQAERIETLAKRVPSGDWTAVAELEDDLRKAMNPDRDHESRDSARVVAAVRDRGESLDAISQFLLASDEWLNEALRTASLRTSDAGEIAAANVQQALKEWQELSSAGNGEQP